ncbi:MULTISPECIES: hypothetical protein [Pseudomonadaceae]|nr:MULTISPECIES: hypothetical protein [Pseudomonadaceae]MBU0947544.1 hypothetical protein [Gammaproteobacteria bacterium]
MTDVLKVASLAATVLSRTDAGLLRLPQADDLLLLGPKAVLIRRLDA